MCGIAAIINLHSSIDTVSAIKAMSDIIRHRGPDDEGFVIFTDRVSQAEFFGGIDTPRNCFGLQYRYSPKRKIGEVNNRPLFAAFGHRRLSIIDISPAGHQPMCSEDGRYCIVFNGEIYNYLELRQELQRLGFVFLTHSDTEVILHAFHQWGSGCLHRFNGMFAFVLYDRQESRLFAARDRFGVKPFYYWRSPRGFLAVASEIKQFTVLPGWNATLNGQRGYDYLKWGVADTTTETLFAGVFQLRGGEFFEESVEDIKGTLRVQCWYQLKPQTYRGSFLEAAHLFKDLFTDSVKLRMRADVPTGTGLSGGLDSSSVVCVVNNLLREQATQALLNTFSACSDIKRFDEKEFIDEVVNFAGVSAHFTYPSFHDLIPLLPKITWHQDEPFASTSIFAEWCVFRLVKQNGVKVTLDGHGSDELLAGYHSFFAPHFAGLLRSFKIWSLVHELRAARQLHGYNATYLLRLMMRTLLPEPIRQSIRRVFGDNNKRLSWLNTKLLKADERNPHDVLGSQETSVNALSFNQFTMTSLPVQLHWADRDSMAHSVEARAPFLDYRLVEFVYGLPEGFKLAHGTTKRILRQAMSGVLPNKIRDRMDKMGFVTPEDVWIRQTGPEKFRQMLTKAVGQSHGIITSDAINMIDHSISGKASLNGPIWRSVNFAAWMELFDVSPP